MLRRGALSIPDSWSAIVPHSCCHKTSTDSCSIHRSLFSSHLYNSMSVHKFYFPPIFPVSTFTELYFPSKCFPPLSQQSFNTRSAEIFESQLCFFSRNIINPTKHLLDTHSFSKDRSQLNLAVLRCKYALAILYFSCTSIWTWQICFLFSLLYFSLCIHWNRFSDVSRKSDW